MTTGDAAAVAEELRQDPGLATRPDPASGWLPLHAVCSSRGHQADPGRAEVLVAVARVLIDAGAEISATPGRRPGWTPLRRAIAVSNSGPSNRRLVELLLERGAVPGDHDLYLAGFAHDRRELLPLLLAHVPDVREIAEQALAAPISQRDTDTIRLLLEAGADPLRYRDDDGEPAPVVQAARRAGCGTEIVELLVGHGAEPAEDDDPVALVGAASAGNTAEVGRLLDLGVPVDTRGGEGETALHAAAFAGKASTVRLLVERGAELEVRDTTWQSTPLGWAREGRSRQSHDDPEADWDQTFRVLIDAGAMDEAD